MAYYYPPIILSKEVMSSHGSHESFLHGKPRYVFKKK